MGTALSCAGGKSTLRSSQLDSESWIEHEWRDKFQGLKEPNSDATATLCLPLTLPLPQDRKSATLSDVAIRFGFSDEKRAILKERFGNGKIKRDDVITQSDFFRSRPDCSCEATYGVSTFAEAPFLTFDLRYVPCIVSLTLAPGVEARCRYHGGTSGCTRARRGLSLLPNHTVNQAISVL